MDDVYHLLGLYTIPGIGSQRMRSLVGHFGTAEKVLKADSDELVQIDGIDEKTAHDIKTKVDFHFVDDQFNRMKNQDVQIVTFWNDEYPEILKTIYDPPIILYVKGNIPKNPDMIGMVGTRMSTRYGNDVAERMAGEMAYHEIVVVSGMARGIDTHVHWGAIKNGGVTIAVLGCGVDRVYPPENLRLYKKIITSGAVISEFPMNTEPMAGNFPRRNRIISGLSLGTIVVEAGERSGALITGFIALEQGREVFAIPGDIRSSKSRGPHRLIKEGAKLAENIEDIFNEIPRWHAKTGEARKPTVDMDALNPLEKSLWEALSHEPCHIDRISKELNLNTSEVLAGLLSLELKNYIKQLSGMMFVRKI